MGASTAIGSGRYELVSPLPATLPRILRYVGRDTVLDREVTVLSLTDVVAHRDQVLEAASRAALVPDRRLQRVLDVEDGDPAVIITEPAARRSLAEAVRTGMSAAQVRAIVGECATALDLASRRDLHHENLSPDSVRLRPDGSVQLCGTGIEAAALGLSQDALDPLAAARADARALVELLYLGLTGRWPGKRRGIPSAPLHQGQPVAPSTLSQVMTDEDADLDALVARTWSDDAPASPREVAQALGSWDPTVLLSATDAPGRSVGAHASSDKADPPRAALSGAGPSRAQASPAETSRPHATRPAADDGAAAGPEDPAGAHAAAHGTADGAAKDPNPVAQALSSALSSAGQGAARGAASVGGAISDAVGGALHRIRETAEDNRAQAQERAEREEQRLTDPRSRAAHRTTTTVIVAAVIAVIIGVLLAAANLLQLAQVSVTDDDVPAARTIPSAIASEQQAEEAAEQAQAADDAAQDQSAPTPAAPPQITSVSSLDPFGDNNEHPELAARMTDSDPTTTWFSRYYTSPTMPGKEGIGVSIALAQEATVSAIDLAGTGNGGHVQIRATAAEDPTGGTLLAEGAFTEGTTTFEWEPTAASNVVVWVTELPQAADGKLKVTIGEITLR